jgi:2-polyprenyl-6-methoxyphenol hydroxylase-like FAD-dependent oxidoreductase
VRGTVHRPAPERPSNVLEKHADFLRDFRGDTIHPSTLEVMHELGLLEAFLQRPHSELAISTRRLAMPG